MVLIILTIAGISVITESIILGWEFWVPPLIAGMMIGIWAAHIFQFQQEHTRENYYLTFGMVIAFYHGVHQSRFFDVLAISVVLMATAALLGRKQFLTFMFWEFFVIMGVQLALENKYSEPDYNAASVFRILLHVAGEVCCYMVLKQIIADDSENIALLNKKDAANIALKDNLDDMLFRISKNLDAENDTDIASRMIRDIGEYAGIRKNSIEVAEREYRIVDLIDDVVSNGGRYTGIGNCELVVDLDPSVPASLRGDRDKLLLIMEHLLDNAFRYTKRGGIYIRITGVKHDENFNLVIEVADTGTGMDISLAEDIASGSYVGRNTDAGLEGIGLGLSIVYGYVRCMNGFVSVESEAGRGTKVRISVHQDVIDPTPCMVLDNDMFLNVVYHIDPSLHRHTILQEYFKQIMNNTASALRFNLYYASSVKELNRLMGRGNITNVIAGKREYESNRAYFDQLKDNVRLTVFDCSPETLYSKNVFEELNAKQSAPSTKGVIS